MTNRSVQNDEGKKKYVDNLGIIEIRVSSDDPEYFEEPKDMFEWQEASRQPDLGFHEKFCQKDKTTTIQKYFHCLVCDCPLKSVVSLENHVSGEKHVRKSLQKKRQEYGMPKDPPHQPQTKLKKKEAHRPRKELIRIPLMERLREENALGLPALGLQYINEWINPRNSDAPRRYTCVLEGCKSAWGDSEDMYRHLVGKSMLHNKNYLIYHLGNEQVSHFKKDEVTEACNQCDKNERGFLLEKERDYSLIQRHMDLEFYNELLNRPLDWSEKKDKHGIPLKTDKKRAARSGSGFNGSNSEPLGKRHRSSSSSSTSFGSSDNPNNVPLGGTKKQEQSGKFDFQPLSKEDQGKQVVEKLEVFCKNIRNSLCTGKGNRHQLEGSLKTFYKLLLMFGRQDKEGSHKIETEKFHSEYLRFLEQMKIEDGLISTLDTYERRLKKFNEDVQYSLKQTNGVFQDQNVYKDHMNYAEEFKQKVLKYSTNQGDFSRQSKEEVDAKISMLLKGIHHVKAEIEAAGNRMLRVVPHDKSPLVVSNGSNGAQATSANMFEDEKSRRLIADFHSGVVDEVKKNMRKYYENTVQIEMVKIATREEFEKLCQNVASTISQKEVERWIREKLPLKDICMTQKMLENIKKYIDIKMKKRPVLADL